jgi:FixJ family two-component response regulator
MSDNSKTMVYIVDDDISVRKALSMLVLSADLQVQTFERPEEFLNYTHQKKESCLIMDVEMKGMAGLDFYKKLKTKKINIPIIFLTASDSKKNRERAKQTGAIGYLSKPVDDQALLDTIQWALTYTSSKELKIKAV